MAVKRARIKLVAQDSEGVVQTGKTVTLTQLGTSTPLDQTVYANRTGATVKSTPFQTDGEGGFEAWTPFGDLISAVVGADAAEGFEITPHPRQPVFEDVVIANGLWIDARYYGVTADGTTDDTLALQAALDAIRTAARGGVLFLPRGKIIITVSLNATVIPSLYIVGCGRNNDVTLGTTISGTLASGRPVLDLLGSTYATVRGLTIEANSTATAGILIARNASNQGDQVTLDDVQVNAPSSTVGVCVIGADLTHFDRCYIYGKTGVVYGATDVLSVTSAYGTPANAQNTKHTITSGSVIAHDGGTGSCVLLNRAAQFNAFGTGFQLDSTGPAYVEVTGASNTRLTLLGCRGEAGYAGDSADGGVTQLHAGASNSIVKGDFVVGGSIDGNFEVEGSGPVFDISVVIAAMLLKPFVFSNIQSGLASVKYFNGGLVRGCAIENGNGLTATVADASYGNTVWTQAGTLPDWFAASQVAGYANTQFLTTRQISDNLIIRQSMLGFGDGDATPNVGASALWRTANTGGTSITTFDFGTGAVIYGHQIVVVVKDANTTFVNGATLKMTGSTNYAAANGAVLTFLYDSASTCWREIGRVVP